jgi:hypothetical protein
MLDIVIVPRPIMQSTVNDVIISSSPAAPSYNSNVINLPVPIANVVKSDFFYDPMPEYFNSYFLISRELIE